MKNLLLSCLVATALSVPAMGQQAEKLDRGVVAVKTDRGVFLSWRCFVSDAKQQGWNVYRDGVKINAEPVTNSTNYTDADGSTDSKYVVKAVVEGSETEASEETTVWGDIYKKVHLDRPEGGTSPDGVSYTYSPNDCSVGDVDGDGKYEIIVKWDPSNSHDNSEGGYTGNVFIDGYRLDGTKLWRIDLGRNIRAGAHYTQFLVYDFDGDGKAELACKTAPGTVDGLGKNVIMGDDDPTADYRATYKKNKGIVLTGPEYLTVFNGLTGAEMATVAYEPARDVRTMSQWGDEYGNRSERYLACVAYLDGQKPSIVMCRGYYTAAYLCAWDFDGRNLTKRWLHKSETSGQGAYGEGAHSLTVGDVDGDGCDEIIYGSAAIDNDGSLLYRTGGGHGDALHLGDFDPDHEGLEVFMVHEEKKSPYPYDATFRDAGTGEMLWSVKQSGNDIGRGVIADLSADYRGAEAWPIAYYGNGSKETVTFDCKGNVIAQKRPSCNFRIYWDGDLQEELLDGSEIKNDAGNIEKYTAYIEKRSSNITGSSQLINFNNYADARSCNTSKKTPCLQADILGDWREEVVLWSGETSSDLLIFTTTDETRYKVPCLMQDHTYRMAVAWQNVGYNQPPHLGYYLPDVYSDDAMLFNGKGELTQTIELGEPISDITYSWKNATGAVAEGLPEGVAMTVDTEAMTLRIGGTPAASGEYPFTIKTTGGETEATVNGKITVRDKIVLTEIASFPFEEVGLSTPNLVYGEAEVTGTATTADGIKGNAISLDGTSYLIQEAYSQMQLGTKDFTIEFWFKSTDDAAYMLHKGSIASNASTGTSGKWVGLELKGGNLKFAIDDNVTKSEASAAAADYFKGEWTYVVCVRDSYTKSLRLYLNGVLAAESQDLTGDISDNDEPFVIGNVNVNFNNTFTGLMDELTVYEGAMSANKIAERYNAGVSSGINEAVVTDVARLTLVSASSGAVVRRGAGNESNVTEGVAPGCYILIKDYGKTREIIKFIKK